MHVQETAIPTLAYQLDVAGLLRILAWLVDGVSLCRKMPLNRLRIGVHLVHEPGAEAVPKVL
jgi:hypothetical protein